LPGIRDQCRLESNRFTPVGETDSEFAFCCLLERLEMVWAKDIGEVPSIEVRLETVTGFAEWLRPLGPFNFVYTDGDTLFVHSHRRTQCDGVIRPPGLHMLVRSCNEQAIDLSQSGIMMAPTLQELTLVASVPLTDEPWEPIAEGSVVALKDGMIRARQAATPPAAVQNEIREA
jgi:glutamine amidotransferase